jgi:hypothetical protein
MYRLATGAFLSYVVAYPYLLSGGRASAWPLFFFAAHSTIAQPLCTIKIEKIREVHAMGNFIEELHYGNINPQDRNTRQNKVVQEQMAILTKSEDFLTKNLPEEHKKSFIAFSNAWDIINGESTLDSFILGFRLGTSFTYDTFVSAASPFQSLSEE